jgi:hypothetical protein
VFYQRLAAAAAAGALLFVGGASAQPAASCCTVPARTPIEIEITDTVNSKTSHTLDSFAFRLAQPLLVDGHVVAPAGTVGVGEVVHAARARAMGKAGELILAARYLQVGETRVPLRTLRYMRQGRDNTYVAFAAGMVVAPLAFVIAGDEVNVPAGTHASVQTAAEVVLPPVP